jgi:hypothetical protein
MSERRDITADKVMCKDCPEEMDCPDYVSGGTCSHGRPAKEPAQPKRDIAADRQEFDRVCDTPDWPSYADFVNDALPHYLDRCEEAEAALEAAIEMLVQSGLCPPSMKGKGCLGPVDDNCWPCWGKYLMAKGKEAVKKHA